MLWLLPESDRWTNSITRESETCHHEFLHNPGLVVMFHIRWKATGVLMRILVYCTISCTIFLYTTGKDSWM